MAIPPEDDIYDDLYGDSADIQDVSPPASASTEEPPVQIHDTSSEPQQRERKVSSGEISLPAKPMQSTELSYSAQIARQFSAYKQTPVQERQQQSRTQGLSTDVEMAIYDGGSTRRPVRPSEMKDEGKLFVGGLSWDTTDEGLRKYFAEFGEVEDCTILRDHDGRSRGFAFLTFKDPSSVNAVMVREHVLDGKAIDPKRAIPREEHLRNTRYFVGGLSHATTSESMRAFFSTYGKVVDSSVMVDRETGRSKGFGFVTFEDASNTDQLVGRSDLILDDKQIEVKVAQPRSQRDATRTSRTTRDSSYEASVNANMSFGAVQPAVNPQQMQMLYQRMMGQLPMMGMGMNAMGMGMPGFGTSAAGMTGMMPMGGMTTQMADFSGMAGGMGGNMGAAMGRGMGMAGNMGGGMAGGMRMGMGPMGMSPSNMGMMRPGMGMMGGGMMRPAMGMMGGMGQMGRGRGGAMVNAGAGPQRTTVRQHGFHPYAR